MPFPRVPILDRFPGSATALCVLSLVVFLLLSPLARADVSGSSDYAGFVRFPGSEIVDYRVDRNAIYALALGRMQRAAGSVAPSSAERLQGHLYRITYQIPDGFDSQEVYGHFRNQLLQAGQRELFACQGRGCGSSNFWANDQFNNRILYGPETSQAYLAATYQSEAAGSPVVGYAALYVVTRANRRMYAHLDFLELQGNLAEEQRASVLTTPEAMQLRLQQDGAVVLQGISFDDDDALTTELGVQLLADVLRRDGMLQLYLVGHLQGEQTLEGLLQRSLRRAEAVRARLIALGIDGNRVQAQGVGPLAPYCRPGPCSQRIEAVVR